MSVPNTITFSLQDVTKEVFGSTVVTGDLQSCFTNATGIFDSNYVGNKNSLLNFRNYNRNALTYFSYAIVDHTNNTDASGDLSCMINYTDSSVWNYLWKFYTTYLSANGSMYLGGIVIYIVCRPVVGYTGTLVIKDNGTIIYNTTTSGSVYTNILGTNYYKLTIQSGHTYDMTFTYS